MQEADKYNDRKESARILYTKQDYTISEIAAYTGADEATIRHWIQNGAWDGMKRSLLTSRPNQLTHLYDLLEKLNKDAKEEGNTNPKTVDLILKYTASVKNLETTLPIATIIEVAELFTTWLLKKDLELTKTVTIQLNAFIKQRIAANVWL